MAEIETPEELFERLDELEETAIKHDMANRDKIIAALEAENQRLKERVKFYVDACVKNGFAPCPKCGKDMEYYVESNPNKPWKCPECGHREIDHGDMVT